MLIFAIIVEIISTLLIIYGFLHEDKFIAFEDKIKLKIRKAKRFCKAVKIGICTKVLAKEGVVIPKVGEK